MSTVIIFPIPSNYVDSFVCFLYMNIIGRTSRYTMKVDNKRFFEQKAFSLLFCLTCRTFVESRKFMYGKISGYEFQIFKYKDIFSAIRLRNFKRQILLYLPVPTSNISIFPIFPLKNCQDDIS